MVEKLGNSFLTPKKFIRLPDAVIEKMGLNIHDVIVFEGRNKDILIKKGKVEINGD